MKNIKRIVLILVAIALVCCFCFAVSASEGGLSAPENGTSQNQEQSNENQGNQTPEQPGWIRVLTMLFPILILVAFFYFGMYRPQKKQEKEKKAMMDSLQVGSDVMTIGGIMGRIVSVKDDSVIIESGSDKNKLQISKQAISTVTPKED